jgi:hypothetical protein
MQAAVDLDARGRSLRGALAAVLVRERVRELDLVHQWLSTWAVPAWSSPA